MPCQLTRSKKTEKEQKAGRSTLAPGIGFGLAPVQQQWKAPSLATLKAELTGAQGHNILWQNSTHIHLIYLNDNGHH